MLELSIAEQKLVEFARESFGEFITRFLLTGLGEEEMGRRWLLTIAFGNDAGAELKRQVQVISHEPEDGSSCLPRRKDSLVLLALLQLLAPARETSNQELLYEQEAVLKLLGWDDTLEARRGIDQAIKRYFLMTFKWGKSRAESARQSLSHYRAMENILLETGTVDQEEEEGRMKRAANRVVFNSNFIGHLKGRSLFDVDWNRVTSVSYVPKY